MFGAGADDGSYLSYHERVLTLGGTTASVMTLDFSAAPVESAVYPAVIHAPWGDGASSKRTLYGVVVFPDNANLFTRSVHEGTFGSDPIKVSMPVLPAGHVVLLAFQSAFGGTDAAFGAAHREAGAADATIVLDVPEPRTLRASRRRGHRRRSRD